MAGMLAALNSIDYFIYTYVFRDIIHSLTEPLLDVKDKT